MLSRASRHPAYPIHDDKAVKILLLTPSVRPLGARRSLVELVRNLPTEHSVCVVCPAADGIAKELTDLGISVRIVPHGAWRKLFGRLKAEFSQIPQLRRIVREFQPDVIHANEFHAIPHALAAARGTQIPVTGHVRLGITPRQIETYSLRKCRRVIAVSEAVKSLFAPAGMADRVDVVYNGVGLEQFFHDGPTIPEFPRSTGLTVGLFGLISPRKNQLLAAEAVALARSKGADLRLLLAGDAFKTTEAYGAQLRDRLAQSDLKDATMLLPFQKDVAALYRSIDINLLISSEEGFGRTIIEAAATSRPSIGARTGGIPELIEEGRTGWLVREGDVKELADLLVELAGDVPKVRQAGEHARTYVETRFTIEAHAQAMLTVWQNAIRRAG